MADRTQADLFRRFQKWVVIAIAFGVILYVGATIWAGWEQVGDSLAHFKWSAFAIAIALTLSNYFLRFLKWHYLVLKLGVKIPFWTNGWNFLAGLSMTISPGKAGELLKPYVLRRLTGVPMARTIPALIAERLTDGIAMLILATIGLAMVSGSAEDADHWTKLLIVGVIIFSGLIVLASERLSVWIIEKMSFLPGVGKISPKLKEMYAAMRTCLAPTPFLFTIMLSIVAWGAECIAYMEILSGLGVDASFGACLFLYAFATVIGIPMPAGLGATDGALVSFPSQFIPALKTMASASAIVVTATLLTRVATMWFGVALGALALFKVSALLGGELEIQKEDESQLD